MCTGLLPPGANPIAVKILIIIIIIINNNNNNLAEGIGTVSVNFEGLWYWTEGQCVHK